MGLVMALGPQIISTGGKSALKTCVALPTRWRSFTCVHSLGHALMRGYHETLFLAVHACSRLGARYAPDCEQGAFHDYWISLRGADDATSPHPCGALAAQALRAVRPLRGAVLVPVLDRAGAWAGDPTGRAICCGSATGLPGRSARAASRVPRRMCTTRRSGSWRCARSCAPQRMRSRVCAASGIRPMPESRSGSSRSSATAGGWRRARSAGCAAWFGQTFNVVENGRFLARAGCPRAARRRCGRPAAVRGAGAGAGRS